MASELRQLAESYKAKAERLAQQLVEERDRAGAQGDLWKQQLSTQRARRTADKERLRQLEERLRMYMQRDGGAAMSPHDGVRSIAWDSTPGSSPRSAPRSGASSMTATPPSNGSSQRGGLRRGVGRVISTATSIDAKVDRALDRVTHGIVGLTTRKAGSFTPVSTDGD